MKSVHECDLSKESYQSSSFNLNLVRFDFKNQFQISFINLPRDKQFIVGNGINRFFSSFLDVKEHSSIINPY